MRWGLAAPLVLLAAGGCLATKNDVALLQGELVVQRAQIQTDSVAAARADDARRAQLAAVSAEMQRANDSLRVLMIHLASFTATSLSNYDQIGRELAQLQALAGQTTANVQKTQQQLEALREQGMSVGAPPPAPVGAAGAAPDTSQHAVPPGTPGPATLFSAGYQQMMQGAYGTARSAFQQLLDNYPNYESAPEAQLDVGESFDAEGNTAAADSVYQVVVAKYPKAGEAATALYKRGKMLWDAGKRAEATPILQRVVSEYPTSDAAQLAKTLLGLP